MRNPLSKAGFKRWLRTPENQDRKVTCTSEAHCILAQFVADVAPEGVQSVYIDGDTLTMYAQKRPRRHFVWGQDGSLRSPDEALYEQYLPEWARNVVFQFDSMTGGKRGKVTVAEAKEVVLPFVR